MNDNSETTLVAGLRQARLWLATHFGDTQPRAVRFSVVDDDRECILHLDVAHYELAEREYLTDEENDRRRRFVRQLYRAMRDDPTSKGSPFEVRGDTTWKEDFCRKSVGANLVVEATITGRYQCEPIKYEVSHITNTQREYRLKSARKALKEAEEVTTTRTCVEYKCEPKPYHIEEPSNI